MENTFKITGTIVDTYSGNGKRGEFHSVVINIGREVKLFSEVSLESSLNKKVTLECRLEPSFDGSARVQVIGVSK